ncbi:MAG TPA: glycosyltransferase, partial [Micromonosporaceae bacterium]|nr:glycosyltransferase [Micromonosporaceae bacterium]
MVVPTYNRAESLRRTLDSLVAQDCGADALEVVVSDDGSSVDTHELCDSYRDRLRLRYTYQEDQGYRVAAARNAGARLATAPVLAFLDSGTVAGPGFAAAHLRHHLGGGPTDERLAVVGYTHAYDNLDGASADILRLLAKDPPEVVVARLGDTPQLRDVRHPE